MENNDCFKLKMFKNGCFLLTIHFYYYVRHVSYLHRQNKSNSHVLHRYNRINRSYSSIFLSKILDEELRLENEGKTANFAHLSLTLFLLLLTLPRH